MSKVLVIISTDHSDDDEAIKSVSNAMKRAGYNFQDYEVRSMAVAYNDTGAMFASQVLGPVQVCEPEVDPRG